VASGCSKKPPNVLFITVDALRADHMGIYGYERNTSPNLDEFFTEATIYEHAYCTEANTGPSVVSFLSGLLPQDTGVRLLCQKVPSRLKLVSDYLNEAGYHTAGIVSNIVLTKEASGLDSHFDYYDDYIDEKEPYRNVFERNARATTDAGFKWYASAYDSKKPYFLWLHYQDTHGPYHPPPDKPVEFSHPEPRPIDIEKVPPYVREPGVTDGLEYVDLYDEELAYSDFHIKRLLDMFQREGLLDNTLVIFSADHGESMMDHERWFTHGYHVYEEIIHVPLLIRYPGQNEGKRVKTSVSLVDLLPTILEAAGIESTGFLRGVPLTGPQSERPLYAQGGVWRFMVYRNRKWLIEVEKDTNLSNLAGVYDLVKDPGELNRLPWENKPEAADFVKLIASDPDPGGIPKRYAKGILLKAPKVRPGLDEKTLKKLRSIGYVN
jgi:arylsulfatase A-like enzyme